MIESRIVADGCRTVAADYSLPSSRRALVDAALLAAFNSKRIRRSLHQRKLNLAQLGVTVLDEIQRALGDRANLFTVDALTLHQRLVVGLPGQSLFVAIALAFDTLNEALPFFQITAKTAWSKLDSQLSVGQSEQALRVGRAAVLAAQLQGSAEGGRRYLQTSNFALGGVTALELLRTAEGERLVLAELQTQADGGPV